MNVAAVQPGVVPGWLRPANPRRPSNKAELTAPRFRRAHRRSAQNSGAASSPSGGGVRPPRPGSAWAIAAADRAGGEHPVRRPAAGPGNYRPAALDRLSTGVTWTTSPGPRSEQPAIFQSCAFGPGTVAFVVPIGPGSGDSLFGQRREVLLVADTPFFSQEARTGRSRRGDRRLPFRRAMSTAHQLPKGVPAVLVSAALGQTPWRSWCISAQARICSTVNGGGRLDIRKRRLRLLFIGHSLLRRR